VDLVVISEDSTAAAPLQVPAVHGKTTICLPGQGSYTLAPKGCYIFSSQAYPVSVSAGSPAQPLKLTAARAYVNGVVRVTPSPGAVTSSPLPPSIEIGTISIEPADSVVEAGVVATATQLNPETEPGVYTYTLALDLGSTVGIEAVQPDGGLLLFKPTRTRYTVAAGSGGCPEAVPDISAYEGVVVSGATEPAVAGVRYLQACKEWMSLSGVDTGGGGVHRRTQLAMDEAQTMPSVTHWGRCCYTSDPTCTQCAPQKSTNILMPLALSCTLLCHAVP
jgi:hypothetical protein